MLFLLLACNNQIQEIPLAATTQIRYPTVLAEAAQCEPPREVGNYWVTMDDESDERCGGDYHSESLVQVLEDNGPDGDCVIRWTGTKNDEKGMAGLTADLASRNFSKYSEIVILTRGSGEFWFQAPMITQFTAAWSGECGNEDYDFYGTRFVCGDSIGGWTEVRINLDSLAPMGWGSGNKWDFKLGLVKEIQFISLQKGPFTCDIIVSDLVERE